MSLFSWLKPKPGSSHWLAWIQSKRKRYTVIDALPRDTSGEILRTNCKVKTFGYPDKESRDQRFKETYGPEKVARWNLPNWRGLCVYDKIRNGRLVEAHIWYPYRTWKGKAIIDSQTAGHEIAHVIDKCLELSGDKDVAHPDKITKEVWWT